MKILVISRVPWDISNSFGNTYDNLLGGNSNLEIANIYCGSGRPNTSVAKRFFCISEKMILRKLTGVSKKCGEEIYSINKICEEETNVLKVEKFAKKNKSQLFYWCRDCIWKTNAWKSDELRAFLDDFRPDLIFAPLYYSIYMNDVRLYIKYYTNAPMISFVSDDVYSLKQFNLSPLYWINRFMIRPKIRKTVSESNKLYVISQKQKIEYDKYFGVNSTILFKGAYLKDRKVSECLEPIRFVYLGNLSVGRWKTIREIGRAVQKINGSGKKIEFDVYSLTQVSTHILKEFDKYDILFRGGIAGSQVPETLKKYDVLIHCESFALKEKLKVRLSFSTKIVDYFKERKCIFAVGPREVASIEYLKKNDAAILATSSEEIFLQIKKMVDSRKIIDEYAEKAWKCGKKNHQLSVIRENLYSDFKNIVGGEK